MFNQGTPFTVDDFRTKLKSYLGWVDETTYYTDRLEKLSTILGVSEYVVKQWTMGQARPSASLEHKLVPQLRSMLSSEGTPV